MAKVNASYPQYMVKLSIIWLIVANAVIALNKQIDVFGDFDGLEVFINFAAIITRTTCAMKLIYRINVGMALPRIP